MSDRWSADDLKAALKRFESELRRAGLSDNTVSTYVGRSDTFVRWLAGDYTPRGPNAGAAGRPSRSGRGWSLLDELRELVTKEELTGFLRDYAGISGYDRSLSKLRETSGSSTDLAHSRNREALLSWLRSWGCRHLRRADTDRSSVALADWWQRWRPELPPVSVPLTDLGEEQIAALSRAYEALARLPAAARTTKSGEIDVSFGDTAAAKTLFAIRPEAVPPWDEPIRLAFGWGMVDAERFERFLLTVRDTLLGLATRLDSRVADLPATLGRPTSSAVKIVDEYLWIRVTKTQ